MAPRQEDSVLRTLNRSAVPKQFPLSPRDFQKITELV